jgi:putative phosphoesterase
MTNILIVSDVHNEWANLQKAITLGTQHHCTHLFFSGDAHSADIYNYLDAFTGEIHCVYGNNDYPHLSFILRNKIYPRIKLHGEEMRLEVAGLHFFMSHYPEDADREAKATEGIVAIHGHTHLARCTTLPNDSIVINPGEIIGTRFDIPTCAIFDTDTKIATFYDLRDNSVYEPR